MHKIMKRGRFASMVVLAAIAISGAGCSASPSSSDKAAGDKAGGPGEPVVLALVIPDSFAAYTPAVEYFIQRVSKLSSGELMINVIEQWAQSAADPGQQTIQDVAAGKADLTMVGSPGFDKLAHSLLALTAPMLIDSYALQDAVLRSDIPTRMLQDVQEIGVTGLGILPGGGLVKPISARHPLLGLADWRGITFATYGSKSQAEAIRALGAIPTDPSGPSLNDGLENGQIQGFSKSLLVYGINVYEPLAPYVTANVNLWPGLQAILVNPTKLARLSDEQRGWLQQAIGDAQAHAATIVDRDSETAAQVCEVGAHLSNASDADLAALRQAFEPAYSALEEDPETKAFIEQIQALKQSTTAEQPLSIPTGCGASASATSAADPLAGTWTTAKLTESEVVKAYIAVGGSEKVGHLVFNAQQSLVMTLQFKDGTFKEYQTRDGGGPERGNIATYTIGDNGTFTIVNDRSETYGYTVTGDTLRLHFVSIVCPGGVDCGPDGLIGPTLYASFPFTRSN